MTPSPNSQPRTVVQRVPRWRASADRLSSQDPRESAENVRADGAVFSAQFCNVFDGAFATLLTSIPHTVLQRFERRVRGDCPCPPQTLTLSPVA